MNNRQFYLPYFLGAAFAIQLLLLWYFSCLAIENKVLPTSLDYSFRFFMISLSSFLGVWAAYRFRIHESKAEEVKARMYSLNQTMIAVARQRSIERGLKEKIDKHLVITDELIRLRPIRLALASELSIDTNSITFAIELGYRNLVVELIDLEHYYYSMIESISIWNGLCDQVDPTNLGTTNKSRLKEIKGEMCELYRSMEVFKTNSDSTVESLNVFVNKVFPDEEFMEIKEDKLRLKQN